jgi:hypothetical protein
MLTTSVHFAVKERSRIVVQPFAPPLLMGGGSRQSILGALVRRVCLSPNGISEV